MRDIENILFFGTPCGFANEVMRRLVDDGYTIAAQIVPGDPGAGRPIVSNRQGSNSGTGNRLPMAARSDEAPVPLGPYGRVQINQHDDELAVRTLREIGADLAVVCCYPRRIPLKVIEVARLGGLNVHPSLLPDYRGPDPLFWVYRNGETRTGVTVHRVDASLDTGPIIGQTAIEVPIGAPGDDIWNRSARAGGALLTESIRKIQCGHEDLTPQDHHAARYFSWPAEKDLMIDPSAWDAWRVYHFCRGVLPLGRTPLLRQGNSIRRVRSVESYDENTAELSSIGSDEEWIVCRGGAVRARLGPPVF